MNLREEERIDWFAEAVMLIGCRTIMLSVIIWLFL